MPLDQLGLFRRFVLPCDADLQTRLREAVASEGATARIDPSLDFFVEGSVEIRDDMVAVRLCFGKQDGILRAWRRTFPLASFEQDSATFADSVAALVNQSVRKASC